MKRVDVYEVSRRIQTTELDYVEFHQMVGRQLGPASEWTKAPLWGEDESPRFVRHSAQVIHLRHPILPDAYLAIDPELFHLLAPAVSAGLHKLCEEQRRASEKLISVNRDLAETATRAESNALLQAGTAQHMSQRIWNFRQANVLRRIWRAIWLRL